MSKSKQAAHKRRLKRLMSRPVVRANRAPVRTTANRQHTLTSQFLGKPETTQEGFLVVPVVIAQKMVLDYPEYGTKELLGDEIFSEQYLKSCDGCPFVLEHPVDENGKPTDVMPHNYEQYVKGVLIDPVVDKENNRVLGKLKVWDSEVIKAIQSGELREVSQGYTCNVIDNSGQYDGDRYDGVQANVVMNHLALVSAGRAGDAVKVLYNGKAPENVKKEFERIDRRRENMKTKSGRANVDEQTTEAGKPNPQNAEETAEQQQVEDDRFAAIEKKLDMLASICAKLAGHEVAEGEITNAETPAPEEDKQNADEEKDKMNEKEKEEVMNKVTNSISARLPSLISQTIGEQTEAYLQAQVLLGEDAQDFATRLNNLPKFRKEVLKRNGMPAQEVDKMSDAEAKVWLKVQADNAKTIMLQPRANSAVSQYTEAGDVKASMGDF